MKKQDNIVFVDIHTTCGQRHRKLFRARGTIMIIRIQDRFVWRRSVPASEAPLLPIPMVNKHLHITQTLSGTKKICETMADVPLLRSDLSYNYGNLLFSKQLFCNCLWAARLIL